MVTLSSILEGIINDMRDLPNVSLSSHTQKPSWATQLKWIIHQSYAFPQMNIPPLPLRCLCCLWGVQTSTPCFHSYFLCYCVASFGQTVISIDGLGCLLYKPFEPWEECCGVLARKESFICFTFLCQLERSGKYLFLRTFHIIQIPGCCDTCWFILLGRQLIEE